MYGAVTSVSRAFPDASTNTHADSALGSSPFARRYWGISVDFFLGVLRCFSSPAPLIFQPMDSVNDSVTNHTASPFRGIAGYNGSYHLVGAYRRLARPSSSPLTARHSPCTLISLNLTTRRCLRFIIVAKFERLTNNFRCSVFQFSA